jgi:hypothetical protein
VSIVAGASLMSGVLLLGDTRATYSKNGEVTYVDNVLKVFDLTTTTAIGFVGNILIAGRMLPTMHSHAQRRVSKGKGDAISLFEWLPRLCKSLFRIVSRGVESPSISFMAAGVVPSRPNVIDRRVVQRLIRRFDEGKLSFQGIQIPEVFHKIMQAPPQHTRINIEGTIQGLVYKMHSPDFTPLGLLPLQADVIGSGSGARRELNQYADAIFTIPPGSGLEELMFRESVVAFMKGGSEPTVGGLLPMYRVDEDGVQGVGYRAYDRKTGEGVSLENDENGDLVQKDSKTGKVVKILPPWKAVPPFSGEDRKFEEWKSHTMHLDLPSTDSTPGSE